MKSKISSEIKVSGVHDYNEIAELPRLYFGYQDTDKLMAEMRAAHEKMTDEDHQRAEEEAAIIWNIPVSM